MGNKHSGSKHQKSTEHTKDEEQGPPKFSTIRDKFETIEQVQEALQKAGSLANFLVNFSVIFSSAWRNDEYKDWSHPI